MLAWKDICFCSSHQLHSSSVPSCTKATGLCSAWSPCVSPQWQPDLLSETRVNSSCFKVCCILQKQPTRLLPEWHTWTHKLEPWAQTTPSRQVPKLEGVFLQVHRQQILHFTFNPNISSDFICSRTQSWVQMIVPRNVMDALFWTALMTPGDLSGQDTSPIFPSAVTGTGVGLPTSMAEGAPTSRVLATSFMETSLDIRNNLFAIRTVKQSNRLPRDLAQSPSSEDF